MIICFDTNTKELSSIIKGNNPIPPYHEEISYIDVDDVNILTKKGDKVDIDKKTNFVVIGTNKIKMKQNKYTIITPENCFDPILLEEL